MHGSKLATFAFSATLACVSTAGFGQQPAKDYPSKPIRLVVPFVAGGSMDFIGHALSQKLAPALGQNLYIDNRSGAGGAIGTSVAAKSPPDGHTILLTSSGHTILPATSKTLPYDPVKDFTPITLIANSAGSVLVVHPSVPVRSVKEFIALAKAHPNKLSYGSGGVGHVMHFTAESFNARAGTQLTHVPYKGVAQALVDLLAGRTDVGFVSATSSVPHIRAGKLRPLAITAPVRWSELADVPTMDEAGVKGYTYLIWYGMWFPAGTPSQYVARIRSEIAKAMEDPALKAAFLDRGLIPVVSTPQDFGRTIAEGIEYHRELVARIGIPLQ